MEVKYRGEPAATVESIEVLLLDAPVPPPGFRPSWFPGKTQHSFFSTLVHVRSGDLTGSSSIICRGHEVKKFIERQLFGLVRETKSIDLENFTQEIRTKLIPRKTWEQGESPGKLLHLLRWLEYRPWVVEIALWDLVAKTKRKPIYELLGKKQTKIRAYASTGEIRSPQQRVRDVSSIIELGFGAIKIRAHHRNPDKDVEVVKAVRDAVGSNVALMVDANQAWTPTPPYWSYKKALRFAKQLEKYGVLWLEEPLGANNVSGIAKLADEVEIPIAGGELEQGIGRFSRLLDAYDIVQPDTHFSGGIEEITQIAKMAEARGKLLIPHNWGTGLSLATNLQVIASLPNCPWVEYPYDPPWSPEVRDFILKKPIEVKGGYVEVSSAPGVGVELNEENIERYTVARSKLVL
jgi:L-alanine-DL-glutamate epimerase-like enolase superfamily enzyme